MTKLGNREEFLPEEKQYSVVKLDTWKAPGDDDFAWKVGEIDSLDERPKTTAGRGESMKTLPGESGIRTGMQGASLVQNPRKEASWLDPEAVHGSIVYL